MLCREIIEKIEKVYPPGLACEWDNVGLLAGRYEKEVKNIYLALDATDEVIRQAGKAGADMLITHHPVIFSPMKKITDGHFIGRRIVSLLQRDISYYAMHTNYDVGRMAAAASEKLGLMDPEVLDVTGSVVEEKDGISQEVEKGIGMAGRLSGPMTLRECCQMVKESFGLCEVKLFGSPETVVERVAVVPGSGKGQTKAAILKGAQVLITGDIDHHEGIDALAQGLFIIDAGHYGLEHIFMEDMETFINQICPELTVEKAPVRHPFQMI